MGVIKSRKQLSLGEPEGHQRGWSTPNWWWCLLVAWPCVLPDCSKQVKRRQHDLTPTFGGAQHSLGYIFGKKVDHGTTLYIPRKSEALRSADFFYFPETRLWSCWCLDRCGSQVSTFSRPTWGHGPCLWMQHPPCPSAASLSHCACLLPPLHCPHPASLGQDV